MAKKKNITFIFVSFLGGGNLKFKYTIKIIKYNV